jgi:hypothetical protein
MMDLVAVAIAIQDRLLTNQQVQVQFIRYKCEHSHPRSELDVWKPYKVEILF